MRSSTAKLFQKRNRLERVTAQHAMHRHLLGLLWGTGFTFGALCAGCQTSPKGDPNSPKVYGSVRIDRTGASNQHSPARPPEADSLGRPSIPSTFAEIGFDSSVQPASAISVVDDPLALPSDGSFDPSVPKLTSPEIIEGIDLATDQTFASRTQDWPVLNLNQTIAACLQNDPVLRAGFEEIALANAEWITSSLKPNPEMEIIQSLLPLTRPFIADEREGGPPQFDVMLSYPIDWYLFGKRAAAMRSTAAEVDVSRAEYTNLIRERVLEASLAYYDVLELQSLVDLAEQDLENFRRVERIIEIGVENGAVPLVELNRVKLDRLGSEQVLRETLRDLRQAKGALRALMGGVVPVTQFNPATGRYNLDFLVEDELSSSVEPSAPPLTTDSLDEILVIAESNRPDIRALNLRLVQTRLEIESQRREAYPEVAPMVGYTRQFQERAIGFPDANSWGAGLAFTIPVHDRNQGNIQLARAQFRQGTHDLRAGLVELEAELVEIIADLETAWINAVRISDEQIRLAEQVRDGITTAYEAGGRPLIDVLDAQRNYRETFGNYIESRVEYRRAIQRLNAAVATELIR